MPAYFRLDYDCPPKNRYGAPMLYQLALLEEKVIAIKEQREQLTASQQFDLQLIDTERGSAAIPLNLADAERALAPLRSITSTCSKCPANFVAQEQGRPRAAGCWATVNYPIDEISESLLGLTVQRLADSETDSNARDFLELIAADQRRYTGLSVATLRGRRHEGASVEARPTTRILVTAALDGTIFESAVDPFMVSYVYAGARVDIGANKVWQLLFNSRIPAEVVPTYQLFVSAWLNEGVRTMNSSLTTFEQRDSISNSRTMNNLLRLRKMLTLANSLQVGLSVEY